MSSEEEVRSASKQFYAALNTMLNADAGPLADIWSHGSDVTTMHPIGGLEVGWDEVRRAWEQVANLSSDGQVKLDGQLICVGGDMAYEVGTELGHAKLGNQDVVFDHRVTNVYRREAGMWKIIHHHTDVSAAAQAVIGQ